MSDWDIAPIRPYALTSVFVFLTNYIGIQIQNIDVCIPHMYVGRKGKDDNHTKCSKSEIIIFTVKTTINTKTKTNMRFPKPKHKAIFSDVLK